MSVVPIERDEEAPRWAGLLPAAVALAHQVKDTSFVPQAMRGDEAAIVAAVMYGDEIGLAPMTALATVAIINGRPTVAAEALRGLINAAGHELWIEDATVTKVTWAGRRQGSQHIARITWSLDDAQRAGLAGKQNWRMYPRAMLSARASAELARAVFSDVIHGLAASEEVQDVVEAAEAAGPPAENPPAAPASTRRRRDRQGAPSVVAPATPPPSKPPQPPLPGEGPDHEPPLPMTDQQRKALMARLRDKPREERIRWANQHLEREIDSFSTLTDAEASVLISELEREKTSGSSDPPDRPEAAAPTPGQAGAADQLFDKDAEQADELLVETLWWMRKEAGVADGWTKDRFEELGAQRPERITRDVFRQLDREQAAKLRDTLGSIIDQRNEERG